MPRDIITIRRRGGYFAPIIIATWTPASLAGLNAWYKADVAVFKDLGVTPCVDGDFVEQWNDQSGNGYHLTQTGGTGSRPIFHTAVINGLPSLTFGSSRQLTNSAVSMGSGQVSSCFVVADVLSTASGVSRMVEWNDGTERCWLLTAGVITTLEGYDGSNQVGGSTITNDTFIRAGGIFDSVNYTSYVGNVAGSSGASSFSYGGSHTLAVSGVAGGGNQIEAKISEIVITTTVISSSDRILLDNYFKTKYGL